MKNLVRAMMGLTLLGSVAVAPAVEVSAQGFSPFAQFCEDVLIPEGRFTTTGECVSTIATLNNRGNADAVGLCKSFVAADIIPERIFGQCVRIFQGNKGGVG